MARALITGCSTGIGRAAAVELTRRGHEVVATARRPESLDGLDVALRLALDVHGPVESVPIAEVRSMFETNYFGLVRMVQAVVPGMRQRGAGVVVNVSSVAGRVAAPFSGFYAGSKFAVEALSEAMHYELAHFGIRVVIIEPGIIETSFGDNNRHVGDQTPPYDELSRQWEASSARLGGGEPAPGPELVAGVVADAVEADAWPLRTPVGADAEMIVATRAALDDATFEATMRETLGLEW